MKSEGLTTRPPGIPLTCPLMPPAASKFVCVEVLRPSQPNGVMSSAVVYLTTRLLGRLSPLSGLPVLGIFFRQKLTTALLESAEGRE